MPKVNRSQHAKHVHRLIRRDGVIGGDTDFIQTPRIAVELLLDVEQFEGRVWEPACGRGAISKVLVEKFGSVRVKSTDLVDRGYGTGGVDFFHQTTPCDNIITNPPFSLMAKFVPCAIGLFRKKMALLLPLVALGGSQVRIRALRDHLRPARVWFFFKKIPYVDSEDRQRPSAFPHMWMVWDKIHRGPTVLDWLTPKE